MAEGRKITITDTVGFIQKLPTGLIESFKSTLAEVNEADLVLEVVDASDSNWEKKRDAVNEILDQIGAKEIRRVLVFNKCDLLVPDDLSSLRVCHPDAVFVSAKEEGDRLGRAPP